LIGIDLRLKPDIENLAAYVDVYGCMPAASVMKKIIESIRKGFN